MIEKEAGKFFKKTFNFVSFNLLNKSDKEKVRCKIYAGWEIFWEEDSRRKD